MPDLRTLPLFDRPSLTEAKVPNLRPYQDKAIRQARAAVAVGKKRILIAAPTGSGKMVLVASIIRTSTVPVLFVAHRMELLDQCVEQLARQGVRNVGVLRGNDERENPGASVQVASIQTLARRQKPPAGLVLIDEAHRSAADSYREHIFDAYPNAIILGFTASPCRGDANPLGDLYQELVVVASYSDLFKRSDWLVAPDCYSSPVHVDLSEIRIKHGDFEEEVLGQLMSQDRLVGNLLEHWLRLAHRHPVTAADTLQPIPGAAVDGERRRTFLFAVNIAHSQKICATFAAAGVRIAHLDGTTPENERRAMLADLRAGRLECVSNVNVLLEGVDAPEVKCVVHARPTWSLVLWLQSCGRIFRPWRGVRPLILDHAGNWDRHGPPHADRIWSLKNVAQRKDHQIAPAKICKACFAYVPLGKHVCPYCGHVFTTEEMRVPTESHDVLLIRSDVPDRVRKEFFDRMATLARVKGYKPGFASAKHRENYGTWPPYEWSDALKASFAADPFWQDAVTKRVRQKEQEEAAWNEGEQGLGADPAGLGPEAVADEVDYDLRDPFLTYDDGEETFSAWTRKMGMNA